MGTRADYYIGKNERLVWLGSIAWDGYECDEAVAAAKTEDEYTEALAAFFHSRDDATLPEQGWPWPWDDSDTTDEAFAFIDDCVCKAVKTKYGYPAWFPVDAEQKHLDEYEWPNMKDKQNVTFGGRSGVMVFGVPK